VGNYLLPADEHVARVGSVCGTHGYIVDMQVQPEIEAGLGDLQRPARLQQIDCHRRISGAVCSRGKLKSHATGPTMLTCALGVTCDARCH
jgi:hypothetical protein